MTGMLAGNYPSFKFRAQRNLKNYNLLHETLTVNRKKQQSIFKSIAFHLSLNLILEVDKIIVWILNSYSLKQQQSWGFLWNHVTMTFFHEFSTIIKIVPKTSWHTISHIWNPFVNLPHNEIWYEKQRQKQNYYYPPSLIYHRMMWDLLCSLEGIKDMMIPLIVVVVKMSDTQIRPSVKQKPGFVATTASFLLDESFII